MGWWRERFAGRLEKSRLAIAHGALIGVAVLAIAVTNGYWKQADLVRYQWDEAAYLNANQRAQDLVRDWQFGELYWQEYNVRPVFGYVTPIVPIQLAFGLSEHATIVITQAFYLGLALISIYLIGAAVFTRGVGLVAAALVALDPGVLVLSRTYWPHLAVLSFSALTTLLLIYSDWGRRRGFLVAAGLALGVAMMTRPMFPAAFALGPIVVVLVGVFDRTDIKQTTKAALCIALPAAAVCLPFYWNQLGTMFAFIANTAPQYAPVKDRSSIANLFWYGANLHLSLGVPLTCLSLVGLVGSAVLLKRKRMPAEIWFLLAWAASGYLLLSLVPSKGNYYMVALHGPLILVGVAVVRTLLPGRRGFVLFGTVLSVGLALADGVASIRPGERRWLTGVVRPPLEVGQGVSIVSEAVTRMGAQHVLVVGWYGAFNPEALAFHVRHLESPAIFYADSVSVSDLQRFDVIVWVKSGANFLPGVAAALADESHSVHQSFQLVQTLPFPNKRKARIFARRDATYLKP